MAHRRKDKSEDEKASEVPRISVDYFYMTKTDEEESKKPNIVVVDESTRDRFARAIGRKGVGGEGEVDWLIRDISVEMKSWGHQGGE